MKSRIAKIVSKAEADNEMRRALLAEQDYELASLSAAMLQGEVVEIERSKKRLAEIHLELAELS